MSVVCTFQIGNLLKWMRAATIMLAALLLAGAGSSNAALNEVSSISLSYTQAEQLAATVNGLFTPDEVKAAGVGRVLIIRAASSDLLKQAEHTVVTLDTRPAQFMLYVRAASHDQSDNSINIHARKLSTRVQSIQSVRVLSGSTVALIAGQLRQVRQLWFNGRYFLARDVTHAGSTLDNSATELVGTELLLAPVLQGGGKEVRLNLASTSRGSDIDGRPRQQLSVDSTVLMPLGRWISIASSGSDSRASSSGLISHSTPSNNSQNDFDIMVELVPE